MKKIKEVIVVEGKNDISKVQSCIDCDCLKTNGTHFNQAFLNQLIEINDQRGIIVFTDDDSPGRFIREAIQKTLGRCKHAYLDKKVSRTDKKVGIEHAQCEDIINALSNVMSMDKTNESITYSEYINSQFYLNSQLRNKVIKQMGLPPMNNKRFFKTLNMLNKTMKEIYDEYNIEL